MPRIAVLSLHTSPLVQPGAGDGGGLNVYVYSLASALARAGLACDVYTRAWRPALPETQTVEPGFAVHHVPAGPARTLDMHELASVTEEFTASVLRAATRIEERPDLIHANYWLSGVAGHALKHELSLPLVTTFHTLERVKAQATGQLDETRASAESGVIGCSDSILAASPLERDQLVRLYGADQERVEVLPPGVDHELFSPGDRSAARRALGLGSDPTLLVVGRIQPLKGLDLAIEVLALLPKPAQLVVVGGPSGPDGAAELSRLRDLVEAHGLSGRVRFLPPQPHQGLASFYRAADACLVPSRSESFGLVALEAAACGTPVIASAVGGLQTIVEHGRTGYLVEGRSAERFAAHAAALLADPELARRLGAGAAAASQRYSWSITAARLRRLYADLTLRQPVECG